MEKEITQSQVTTLGYLQISMMLLWSLINMVFVFKNHHIGPPIVVAILWAFTSFMYAKKHKQEPLSRYLTIRAILVNVIGLSIMSVANYYLDKYEGSN